MANLHKFQTEKINIRKELNKYLKYWFWFLLSITVSLYVAHLYLKFATPVYSAKASIIIRDISAKGITANNLLADLGASGSLGNGNIDTEIGILNSRSLMKEVIKSLNLHIQYFEEDNVSSVELYNNLPFTVKILRLDEEHLKKLKNVTLKVTQDANDFSITDLKQEKTVKTASGIPLKLEFADLVFINSQHPDSKKFGRELLIRFSDPEKIASHYRNKIKLKQEIKNSGLLQLELTDPVKEKARDILDQLVLEFNRDAIEDKNLIAGNTANFINDRLSIINKELEAVESGKEAFKEKNQLTDIQTQSNMFMQNANEFNKQQMEMSTQLELSNAILDYINSDVNNGLLPSNLGITEGGVNQQINEYNSLVLERNRILKGSGEKNPVVIRYNDQIDQLKGNVLQSLRTMRSNLQIGQEELNRQASSVGSKIFAVPSKEREFRGIERQQNIKETLYLFLLQKREENSLSLALTEPKAKIVDRAYFSENAVFPNPRNIYLGTVMLALFIPFSVIYAKRTLDNKVRNRADVVGLGTEVNLLGVIPKTGSKNKIIRTNDRSVLAESFRILITNLHYLLVNSKNKSNGKTIFITSTIKGEGKTFTAINLAITLANTGKKVLLMGADLRNPKMQLHIKDSGPSLGISDYLVNDNIDIKNLIRSSTLHESVDILSSGSIPPNPYELLKQEKIANIFLTAEERYDYILVDTAPSLLVADTFLLTKYADLILYLVRAGHTEKDLLEFPITAQEEGKLFNVSFILNDVKIEDVGYGNKYGYGYEAAPKKTIWIRKKKFSF